LSRIGKLPILIPDGVKVKSEAPVLYVEGPNGSLKREITKGIYIDIDEEGKVMYVKRENDSRKLRALHGLYRSLINNMVAGVSKGFEKTLEIVGVGYRAELSDNKLKLNLGFSHQVLFDIPKGIKCEVEKQTIIKLKGMDKELVGDIAAKLRGIKLPDSYKGKGIRYSDEVIKLKVGKTVVK